MGWELTILELRNGITRYKVTRRFPEHSIAETIIFNKRKDAELQLHQWLEQIPFPL